MPSDSYRVLVIDDDGNMRQLLRLLLEQHNHQVLLAPDGEIGVALAEGERPDIVLLDIRMPRRHGIDVYFDLQNNPLTTGIPVIICSAALTESDRRTWSHLPHVVDVLMKPFDISSLLARIEEVCSQRVRAVGEKFEA